MIGRALWLVAALLACGSSRTHAQPVDPEVARVVERVGAAPLPAALQWEADRQGLTLEAALAALPRPRAPEDPPWGAYDYRGAERFVAEHGAVLATLQAYRRRALRALSRDEAPAALLARALLRDPQVAGPALALLHRSTGVRREDSCLLVDHDLGRELLEILTGLPLKEAYPTSPERLEALLQEAKQRFVYREDYDPCFFEGAAPWEILYALGRVEDLVALADEVVVVEVTSTERIVERAPGRTTTSITYGLRPLRLVYETGHGLRDWDQGTFVVPEEHTGWASGWERQVQPGQQWIFFFAGRGVQRVEPLESPGQEGAGDRR